MLPACGTGAIGLFSYGSDDLIQIGNLRRSLRVSYTSVVDSRATDISLQTFITCDELANSATAARTEKC